MVYFKPSPFKLRVLHLTDLHIDFEYQPHTLADCDQPLCCRAVSSSKNKTYDPSRLAGFWGDYRNCDVPIWTVENMFEHIAENEQVYFYKTVLESIQNA
jgi:sphingomyelin phosphodiesterase